MSLPERPRCRPANGWCVMAVGVVDGATTVAAWPLAVCDVLAQRGFDADRALAEAGLDRARLVGNAGGRVPTEAMARLWEASVRLSGDPALGLAVGQKAQPMHLRVVGLLLQMVPDLATLLEYTEHFQRLISTSVVVARVHRPEAIGLHIRPLAGVPVHPCALDAFVAAHVHHLRRRGAQDWIHGVSLPRRASGGDPQRWRDALGCPVRFDGDEACIWHERGRLHQPLPLGDPELCRLHYHLAEQALEDLDREPPLIQTLRGLLRAAAPHSPTLAELAGAVTLSERTLRRRLAELGSGYRQLLEQQRSEWAAELVADSHEPLSEVAARLGFTDPSNFGKAFKRWHGISPDRYRRRIRGDQ